MLGFSLLLRSDKEVHKHILSKKKSNVPKISITSHNNASFLIKIFVIPYLGFLTETEELCKVMYLKSCYLAIFLIAIFCLKFQVKDGFPFDFNSLQKCSKNDFFNLETITLYSTHNIESKFSLFGYY